MNSGFGTAHKLGSAGFLCNSCVFGFFRKGASCVRCPEDTYLSKVLITSIMITLLIVFLKTAHLVSKMKVTALALWCF